uniref:Uncharacterized protein n=3 Tax=Aegilops tauschii subsp. strangulata TaxID=200361 RepID=A0A453AKF8_AEGTS
SPWHTLLARSPLSFHAPPPLSLPLPDLDRRRRLPPMGSHRIHLPPMGSHRIALPPSTPPHHLPPSTHTGRFTLSRTLSRSRSAAVSPTSRGPSIPPIPSDPEAAGQGLRRRGLRLLRVEPRGAAHARRRLHRMPWQTRLASRWTAPAHRQQHHPPSPSH